MSHELPSAALHDGTLGVRFLDAVVSRSVEVACVIDRTDFGDVVGIEILDFLRQIPGALLEGPRSAGVVRWSYDAEIDAFYLHLMDGRGQTQTSIVGTVGLDDAQRVVLLEAPVPS
jgi:uncharacterized protein YuzE